LTINNFYWSDVMAQASNPRTQEAEADGLQVGSQPGLHSETLSDTKQRGCIFRGRAPASKHEALSSNPSATKKQTNKKNLLYCILWLEKRAI
jgi:hypothetical protein